LSHNKGKWIYKIKEWKYYGPKDHDNWLGRFGGMERWRWVPMKHIKESNPVELAEYAIGNGISE
jgi:hypothetical protein